MKLDLKKKKRRSVEYTALITALWRLRQDSDSKSEAILDHIILPQKQP
jgi:hypothetical protein